MRVPDSGLLPKSGVGRAPTRRPWKRQRTGDSSTLLQPDSASRQRIQSKRMNAHLFASGLDLSAVERYRQACLIQRWQRSLRDAGSARLARRINHCMRAQTNEGRIRRLRQSLPDRPTRRPAPHKPEKQYRPRFPIVLAEECLWPLVEPDQ